MSKPGMSKLFYLLTIVADLVGIAIAVLIAYYLRFSGWLIPLSYDIPNLNLYLQVYPIMAIILLISNQYTGLYLQRRGISGVDELPLIARSTTITFLILIGLTYFYSRGTYSRVVLVYAWLFTIINLTILRSSLRRIQIALRRRGIGIIRVAFVGMTTAAQTAASQIKRYPGLGYRLIGLISEETCQEKEWEGMSVLGSMKDLETIIDQHGIQELIFALPAASHAKMEEAILRTKQDVGLKILSDLFGIITHPLTVDDIHGIPIFALKETVLTTVRVRIIKRTFDLLLTVPGIILLSPLLLLIAILVKCSSPGPVLFKQERIGRDNHPFKVLKFRSMVQDAEAKTGPVWATKADNRTTWIGGWLRKTSLDELPQLLNILKGEMSLVGPRPERPFFVEQFKKEIPNYLERHKVKSGLTGWAQVNGLRGNTPIEERTKYDMWYVENWSLLLDIKIIVRTALEFLHHRDAY